MKITLAIAMLAVLGGCAGSGVGGPLAAGASASGVTGDQRGGRIPNGMADVPASMQAATDHCAKYGKKAQITQMAAPSEGGLIGFECR